MYNFGDDVIKNQHLNAYLKIVADLLLKGYAIELMDGDNSFIWYDWIKAVMDELD